MVMGTIYGTAPESNKEYLMQILDSFKNLAEEIQDLENKKECKCSEHEFKDMGSKKSEEHSTQKHEKVHPASKDFLEGYRIGRYGAWNLAKSIIGMAEGDRLEVFGGADLNEIFESYNADDAETSYIKFMMMQPDKPKTGDLVVFEDSDGCPVEFVVLETMGDKCSGININTGESFAYMDISDVHLTGIHYAGIVEMIKNKK